MLKHALLRSKQNGRLDTLTHTLLKHGEDRNLQLIASSVRDASDVSGRRRRNMLRHKNALSSYAQKPDAIVKEGDNRWKVFCGTRTDVSYEVVIGSPCDCDNKLNSHCQRCGICAYQVSCNCHEAYQAGVSCIHAHAVATFVEEARLLLGSANSQPGPLYSVMEDVGTSAEMYVESNVPRDGSPTRTAPDISAPPEDVLAQDRTKEAYQFSEGVS
ncbi:unnamed protein product [Cylicostephanus goldi]|uniref:SWIM-type domain-containing protein n=1 Tax=Cylicostephanus goldi TaxID=71465 RepID=A0A3P6RET0_CYLGO|nr:unnamed protein product [Cylicostephanus goldi]